MKSPSLPSTRRGAFALVAALALPACRPEAGQPPSAEAPPAAASPSAQAPAAAPENLPLKAIMQGLELEMTSLAHALWLEDPAGVAAAAGRVADHPEVTPEQMAIIQTTLGQEFAAFVHHDHTVHEAALALTAAAGAGAGPWDLMAGVAAVQEGCVGCHTAFRARVSAALAAGGG